jgi:hypothetical protein
LARSNCTLTFLTEKKYSLGFKSFKLKFMREIRTLNFGNKALDRRVLCRKLLRFKSWRRQTIVREITLKLLFVTELLQAYMSGVNIVVKPSHRKERKMSSFYSVSVMSNKYCSTNISYSLTREGGTEGLVLLTKQRDTRKTKKLTDWKRPVDNKANWPQLGNGMF